MFTEATNDDRPIRYLINSTILIKRYDNFPVVGLTLKMKLNIGNT